MSSDSRPSEAKPRSPKSSTNFPIASSLAEFIEKCIGGDAVEMSAGERAIIEMLTIMTDGDPSEPIARCLGGWPGFPLHERTSLNDWEEVLLALRGGVIVQATAAFTVSRSTTMMPFGPCCAESVI